MKNILRRVVDLFTYEPPPPINYLTEEEKKVLYELCNRTDTLIQSVKKMLAEIIRLRKELECR